MILCENYWGASSISIADTAFDSQFLRKKRDVNFSHPQRFNPWIYKSNVEDSSHAFFFETNMLKHLRTQNHGIISHNHGSQYSICSRKTP